MNSFKPSKPQWSLAIKPGSNSRWAIVGAGWNTERGGISLRLSRDCSIRELTELLQASDGHMMLFHNEDEQPAPVQRQRRTAPRPTAQPAQRDYMEEKRASRQPAAPPQPDVEPPTGEPEDEPGWL